jgi:hypothetical protein
MRGEQIIHALSRERIDDEKVRGGGILLRVLVRDLLRGAGNLT